MAPIPNPASVLRHLRRLGQRSWQRTDLAWFTFRHGWRRTERRPPPLSGAGEILVIRPDEIGDIVLASAFLRELRRSAPRARITLAVKPGLKAFLAPCPHVDRLVGYDWERHVGPPRGLAVLAARLARTELAGAVYDYVLLPRRGPDWYQASFLAWTVDSRCVAGVDDQLLARYPDAPRPGRYLDRSFRDDRILHETVHSLEFLRWLGGTVADESLEVWPASADQAAAQAFIGEHFRRDLPLVVVHPSGGRSPLKQWPVERFQKVTAALAGPLQCQLLVIGGSDEAAWMRSAFPERAEPRIVTAPGRFTLGELAALLGQASLFLGGDSGPMHMAAATGIPTLGIFGPTSEIRFAPRGRRAQVLSARVPCTPDRRETHEDRCQACLHSELRCMLELPADVVIAAARAALGAGRHPA